MSLNEQEDDYRSSDDEDYVPETGIDDAEDEPSGDEVEEVSAEDSEILTGKRRAKAKSKKNLPSEPVPSTSSEDADDIFAAMMAEEERKLQEFKAKSAGASSSPLTTSKSENEPSLSEAKTSASIPSTSSDNITDSVPAKDSTPELTTITEVFDFAGEEVKVEKAVTAEERKAHEEREKKRLEEAAKPKKRIGLSGALTLLAKKPKMSVLDKSNLDWRTFKTENKLEEELETYNKGKNGYLNKVEFLTRTDLREFESEKVMRMNKRK